MKKEQISRAHHSLDANDCKILDALQADARISIRELASRVNMSPTPVHERLKKLEANGIIDRYSAIINQEKFEQIVVFFVNVVLKEHSSANGRKFIKAITAFPEVVEFYTVGGEHDFMIKVIVHDMKSYRSFFVDKLGEVANIAKLQSTIVLDTIKRDIRIPLQL